MDSNPACRTCLKVIEQGLQFFNLDVTVNERNSCALMIKSKLETVVPELTLDIIKDSIICNECVDLLCTAYEFKKKCLETEEKIYNYILHVGSNIDALDINLIVKWVGKDYIPTRPPKRKPESPLQVKPFKKLCNPTVNNVRISPHKTAPIVEARPNINGAGPPNASTSKVVPPITSSNALNSTNSNTNAQFQELKAHLENCLDVEVIPSKQIFNPASTQTSSSSTSVNTVNSNLHKQSTFKQPPLPSTSSTGSKIWIKSDGLFIDRDSSKPSTSKQTEASSSLDSATPSTSKQKVPFTEKSTLRQTVCSLDLDRRKPSTSKQALNNELLEKTLASIQMSTPSKLVPPELTTSGVYIIPVHRGDNQPKPSRQALDNAKNGSKWASTVRKAETAAKNATRYFPSTSSSTKQTPTNLPRSHSRVPMAALIIPSDPTSRPEQPLLIPDQNILHPIAVYPIDGDLTDTYPLAETMNAGIELIPLTPAPEALRDPLEINETSLSTLPESSYPSLPSAAATTVVNMDDVVPIKMEFDEDEEKEPYYDQVRQRSPSDGIVHYTVDQTVYIENTQGDLLGIIKQESLNQDEVMDRLMEIVSSSLDAFTKRKHSITKECRVSLTRLTEEEILRWQNVDYDCWMCQYKTSVRDNLKDHVQKNHCAVNGKGKQFYMCSHCIFLTQSKIDLGLHIVMHFSITTSRKENSKSYACKMCSRVVSTEDAFRKHFQMRHWVKGMVYLCSECKYYTPTKSAYKSHMRYHRFESIKKMPNFTCKMHRFRATDEIQYRIHLESHDTWYFCNECQQKEYNREDLRQHYQDNHFSSKPFKCLCSDKIYRNRNLYITHMMTHADARRVVHFEHDYTTS